MIAENETISLSLSLSLGTTARVSFERKFSTESSLFSLGGKRRELPSQKVRTCCASDLVFRFAVVYSVAMVYIVVKWWSEEECEGS